VSAWLSLRFPVTNRKRDFAALPGRGFEVRRPCRWKQGGSTHQTSLMSSSRGAPGWNLT
jgi:hypothetical protein